MSTFARFLTFAGCLAMTGMFASVALSAEESHQEALDETIVVDEEPEAFFITAPRALETRMRVALEGVCKGKSQSFPTCTATSLRFLRAVSVYGRRREYGFACDNNALYARNKYFTPGDIRANSSCVYIYCETGGGQCDVPLIQSAPPEPINR